MHQVQGFFGNILNCRGIMNQLCQYTSPSFGSFIGQDRPPIIPVRQRFSKNFSFLKLEAQLDSTNQGMLDCGHCVLFIVFWLTKAEKSVFVITYNRTILTGPTTSGGSSVSDSVLSDFAQYPERGSIKKPKTVRSRLRLSPLLRRLISAL